MQNLYLLDAYALIFRAYYAFIKNPRINSRGENTSAVLGFVNTLEEVLQKQQPTHLGVAFDPPGGTFRHEAYPPYKAQREETPEGIRFAVPYIKRIIEAYHIPILEVPGFEADDVIGTLARQADERGIDTYMMTPDKDYGQLVTPRVRIYRPPVGKNEAELMGPEEVNLKWGLTDPRQVIDMLGLMGDAVDNIPGCPGVGEKTATRLIQQFGSIENLLEHTEELKGALKEKVEANAEQIRQSKWLATIRTDVPISLDMEALQVQQPDEEQLRALFEELEFRTLMRRKQIERTPAAPPRPQSLQGDLFANLDATPETVAGHQAVGGVPRDDPWSATKTAEAVGRLTTLAQWPHTYHLVETREERLQLAKRLLAAPEVCLDTETTGTDPLTARLVGLSFAIQEGEAVFINRDLVKLREILFIPNKTHPIDQILTLYDPLWAGIVHSKDIVQDMRFNIRHFICGVHTVTQIAVVRMQLQPKCHEIFFTGIHGIP